MNNPQSGTRRLAAIMFSDICAYSRRMHENEAHALALLARHDAIVLPAIEEFHGHVIKRMGDGVLAEFRSAAASVECALAIQRRFRDYNEGVPEPDRFQIRIGVHLGDILFTESDILGDGVNVASRIEPLALPGGICISQDVYNQVHNKIELQAVSLGPQQLKNIQRQIEIYKVLVEAAHAPAAPVVPPRTGPAQTAPPPKSFTRVLVIVLILVGLVLGLGVVRGARTRQRVRRALEQADQLSRDGRPGEARRLLETTLASLPPGFNDRRQLTESLAQATDTEAQARIRDRYHDLLTCIARKDWDACADHVAPEDRMRLGDGGIRLVMGALALLSGALQITPDDVRLREIRVDKDHTTASAIPEIRHGGAWKEQKPDRWIVADGEWHLCLDKVPADAAKPAPAR